MVSSMVHDYNAQITGNKRKNEDLSSSNKKTLKDKVETLLQVQDNLLALLKTKVGITDEEIEKCKAVVIDSVPIKRNVRINPGIYTDTEKRKYYVNRYGVNVYKRPCGKPRKDMEWCYATGAWVPPMSNYTEEETVGMKPDDYIDNSANESANESDEENDEENDEVDDANDTQEIVEENNSEIEYEYKQMNEEYGQVVSDVDDSDDDSDDDDE